MKTDICEYCGENTRCQTYVKSILCDECLKIVKEIEAQRKANDETFSIAGIVKRRVLQFNISLSAKEKMLFKKACGDEQPAKVSRKLIRDFTQKKIGRKI